MSTYGLIKATSRAMRVDSIHDLDIVNKFRKSKGLNAISPYAPSVRALENSIALGLEKIDITGLPKLLRSHRFYLGCIPEIKEKERSKYFKLNP